MQKKVVLVARDFAGCFGLKALKATLETLGMECVEYLGFGKPIASPLGEIRSAVERADAVVVGRSSSAELAEPEIEALAAGMNAGIPCFMYSDAWVTLLPWFREFYERMACLFVLHEFCAGQARWVFPEMNVVVSGNPEWEDFYPGPDYDAKRAEMREWFWEMGAPADAQMILVPGVKTREHNLILWSDVAEAASRLGGFCMVASMHPGDRNDPAGYRNDLAELGVPMIFLNRDSGVSTVELVPACDWIISSFSTLGDRACCQGKRVIDYISPQAHARLVFQNSLLPVEKQVVWFPIEAGASRLVTGGVDDLETAIAEMSTPEGFAPYRQAQLRLYGEQGPAPGTAAGIMAAEIMRVLSNR